MQTRTLGRTGRTVSVIGLGTWQLGADWGDVDEADALAVLDAAHEAGVTFFDTADVYGDGRSETLIGRWLREHPGSGVTVATKMGRRMPQEPENYTLEHFRAWTDRSRANLGVDTLDLVQLHCPPTSVYSDDAVFDALDTLVDEGAIAAYGVSVETGRGGAHRDRAPARGNRADHPQRVPAEAARRGAARGAARPASASSPACRSPAGCCRAGTRSTRSSPRTTTATTTATASRSTSARPSRASTTRPGVRAAGEFTELARAAAPDATPAQVALAWIAAQAGVSSVIPGARNPEQARANAAAGSLELPAEFDASVRELYDREIRAQVHGRW